MNESSGWLSALPGITQRGSGGAGIWTPTPQPFPLPWHAASEESSCHQGFTQEGERSTTLYKSDFLGERLQSCLQ